MRSVGSQSLTSPLEGDVTFAAPSPLVGEGRGEGSFAGRATPLPKSAVATALVGLPHKGGGNIETGEQQTEPHAP
jgi:hypothetical protein